MYPDFSGKERENAITKAHGSVFIMQIGGKLKSGNKHDGRAPDYDDWELNGDLLFYDDMLDIPFEVHIYSAHRTPEEAREFSLNARENGFGAIICAAGMAAHLAGAVAANTTLPVIGIPCKSSVLDGMDALLSTVMMPPGIPVATVAINGGANAALLAAQIIAVEDKALADKLDAKRKSAAAAVLEKDKNVLSQL